MPSVRSTESRTEYLPEFGRAVRIREIDRPMMSDEIETAQTVAYMDEIAAADARDRSVKAAVEEALADAGIDSSADPLAIAQAVFWWLKRTIRYVPTPGTSPLVDQTLIAPTAILAMPEPIGDCPQFSMLASAMFRVCCINSLFVTIAAEPSFPDQYSHVYNTVEVSPNVFLPFDASNGPEPGAEYAKPLKRKVWPRISPGVCITSKEGEPMVRTAYNRSGGGMRNRALRGALRGLQCDVDGNCYDDGENVTGNLTLSEVQSAAGTGDCAYGSNGAGGCLPAPILFNPSPTTTPPFTSSPAGSGGGLAQFFTTLANDAAAIAAPLVRSSTQKAPYFITSPSGQSVLYNPNSGTVGNSATIGSAINPTYLVIGLGALAAFAFLGKK